MKARIEKHNNSKGAKYTKGKLWKLAYYKNYKSKSRAMSEEYRLKKNYNLRFRPVCRVCERILNAEYSKTPAGKLYKSKADKKYAASGKKKISQNNSRAFFLNAPT